MLHATVVYAAAGDEDETGYVKNLKDQAAIFMLSGYCTACGVIGCYLTFIFYQLSYPVLFRDPDYQKRKLEKAKFDREELAMKLGYICATITARGLSTGASAGLRNSVRNSLMRNSAIHLKDRNSTTIANGVNGVHHGNGTTPMIGNGATNHDAQDKPNDPPILNENKSAAVPLEEETIFSIPVDRSNQCREGNHQLAPCTTTEAEKNDLLFFPENQPLVSSSSNTTPPTAPTDVEQSERNPEKNLPAAKANEINQETAETNKCLDSQHTKQRNSANSPNTNASLYHQLNIQDLLFQTTQHQTKLSRDLQNLCALDLERLQRVAHLLMIEILDIPQTSVINEITGRTRFLDKRLSGNSASKPWLSQQRNSGNSTTLERNSSNTMRTSSTSAGTGATVGTNGTTEDNGGHRPSKAFLDVTKFTQGMVQGMGNEMGFNQLHQAIGNGARISWQNAHKKECKGVINRRSTFAPEIVQENDLDHGAELENLDEDIIVVEEDTAAPVVAKNKAQVLPLEIKTSDCKVHPSSPQSSPKNTTSPQKQPSQEEPSKQPVPVIQQHKSSRADDFRQIETDVSPVIMVSKNKSTSALNVDNGSKYPLEVHRTPSQVAERDRLEEAWRKGKEANELTHETGTALAIAQTVKEVIGT